MAPVWFEKLSARERRLVEGLGGFLGVALLIFIPLRISGCASERQRANEDLRSAINDIDAARARIAARRAMLGDIAARYANRAPQLGILVDTAARASALEISVQSDLPPAPRGKLYTERATRLTIQKTGLKPLSQFLERIETSGHPVAVTQFDMTKRIEPDAYTVNMTIAAYDRAEGSASPPAAATGGGGR